MRLDREALGQERPEIPGALGDTLLTVCSTSAHEEISIGLGRSRPSR